MLPPTETPSERPGKRPRGKKRRGGEDLPTIWRRRRLIISILLLVLAGIGVGGYFGIKHGYAWLRERQIDRNLESAQVAARLQDWARARNLARSVLLERPQDFEAFLVWHRALAEMREPRAYMTAIQLFTNPRASRELQLEALRVMSLQAPQAIALSAYASLDESLRDSAEARAAIGEVLLLRGEVGLAEGMMRSLPDLDEHPRARLILLRALCAIPSPERVAEARRIFADLIRQDASEQALDALSILGETPGGLAAGEPLPRLPEWVQRQAQAQDLHHLLALHPSIDALPSAADSVFAAAVERFRHTAPGALGHWLIRHDREALAAEVLEEAAHTRPEAFIARLHALVREKRMAEASELLANPPPNTDPLDLEFVHVAVARFQGNRGAETSAWNRALNHALLETSQNHFLEIARRASLMEVPRIAERAWVAALRVGWGRLPLYNDLTPLLESLAVQNRTLDLLAVYRALLRYEPLNPELQNNFYYLALLHGVIQPQEALERLTVLAEAQPEMPELYSAVALAALMAGEPGQALDLLPRVEQAGRVSPMMRNALEGTTLTKLGRGDEARALLESVNWQLFLHQENIVFRKLLQESQVRDLDLPEVDALPAIDEVEDSAAWRKAMERMERERATEILPTLPTPRIPSNELRTLPPAGRQEAGD